MISYIKECLGCEVSEQKYNIPKNFPLYLKKEYSYKIYTINDVKCLAVKPSDFSLPRYKKQRLKMTELSGMPIILLLARITPYQRKALIEEKIPFIVADTQIYLPFLAICLTEKYNRNIIVMKFTPVTQLVFLYIYYNKVTMTASELSKMLGYTVMSINRAYTALTQTGLFQYRTEGRKKYLVTDMSDDMLLKAAEQYMINPIIKTVYCAPKSNAANNLKSGLYALSSKTMLDVSENEVSYAVSKENAAEIDNIISYADANCVDFIRAEYWSYDPKLLSEDDCVDDISLILSLMNTTDERVQIEIEELRRKYKWNIK